MVHTYAGNQGSGLEAPEGSRYVSVHLYIYIHIYIYIYTRFRAEVLGYINTYTYI